MRSVVVGSGIVGASAAYHLAALGCDVVIVDAGHDGQATAAGAGVVFPWPLPDTAPPMAVLGRGAAEHYPRLVDALLDSGVNDAGYAVVGGMTVGEEGSWLGPMHEGLRRFREQPGMEDLGEIARLAAGEPAHRFPVLHQDLAGIWVSGIARVDGRTLRDALLSAATARGATSVGGTATLAHVPGRVTGVMVDDELVEADAVVVAAGAWSGSLCQPLQIALPLFPQRGQILHLDLPRNDTGGWPIVRTLNDRYLLSFPAGRLVAGATRESAAGFDFRITAGGLYEILGDALAVAPGLNVGTVVEVRVGFRPASCDDLPLLGPVKGHEGLVIATGLGAVGLTLGPYVGAIAADLAIGRDVQFDLAPFRPDRPVPPC